MPRNMQRASAMLLEAAGKMQFCQVLIDDVREENAKKLAYHHLLNLKAAKQNMQVIRETLLGADSLLIHTTTECEKALDEIAEFIAEIEKANGLDKQRKPK